MVKIVTDSSADLPAQMARDLDVTVAPLSIHFGDKTYIDGQDIDADMFYRLLRTEHAHPRTAQPSTGLFEEAFRDLAAQGEEIVAIMLSASLSGTYNSAALAAQNVPEARVTLIDSRTISMALGSMVLRAARMAREGHSADEIAETVRGMMPRLTVFIMVDTLTYLQRGGRIGRAGSLLGTMLNIKPMITLHDGEVVPLQRVRTRARALQEMAALVQRNQPVEELYVLHTAAYEAAGEFATMLRPFYDGRDVPVMSLGPVVGVHVGPGCVGAVVLRKG